MANVEVTLNSYGNSVKYQGYVLDSCNNNSHIADGSWSPSSATGMTVSTSGATITITHNNTSTSDASSTFTWTSSKVSGCSKTLKVTAKGKKCTPVKFSFSQSTYDVNFSSFGEKTTIILNIEDWGDVTSDNYNTWGTNGNHLSITSSIGALAISSKTYNYSGNFSIVVTLGGAADITGDIICKDIVCSGEAKCTINATYGIIEPTGKILFNYTTTYNDSAFRVVVLLESTKNVTENVASVYISSSENTISGRNIYNFESQYANGFTNVKVKVVGSASNGHNNIKISVSSSAIATGYTSSKNLSSYNYNYTFDTGLSGYSTSTINISMVAGAY